MDSSFQHFKDGPGPGWTAGPEVAHVSWLDSDECEHTETLTDGREAHSLIEAILRDENLTLMAYDHKSERKKKLDGPERRTYTESHSCFGAYLYAVIQDQAASDAQD